MEIFSRNSFVRAMNRANANPAVDLANVATRVRNVREAYGMASGDFARSIGVDPSSYSKIEKGTKPLKMEMGVAVCEAYGVTLDYIYRGRLGDLPEKVLRHLQSTQRQAN
ncbi:helix-turn-helix domain-containing protein [Arenibacterium halophilum]|uniref:Helix-turn-helix transcriptional regulator n=1 Tax=Arenibacterium halophilum TaxID=2583821 RepID=A0ABY2XCT5_9RHOB|nr:helix-turn-helix transcriptional regulator [Arenibacterium halophilum]TMV14426.1 helix-turn-helix transcriptional regulator [Arenibacterium halophilum]